MKIIRTRRKTLALIITPDGELLVRAPLRATQQQIADLIDEHAAWIQQTRAKAQAQLAARPALPGAQGYQPGELFPVLGVDYPLTLTPTARPDLQFNGAVFCMSARAHPRASLLFERWYRRHARAEFTRRVAHLAGQHGFQPGSVRISSARTRWGSCSASGTLSFAWRLVMAPPEIIDYVIIHELCHLRQRNHSPAFWTLVTGLLPNYRLQRDWLKINGARLGLAPAGASETTR